MEHNSKTVRDQAFKVASKHSDAVNCSTDSFLIRPVVRAFLVILFVLTDFAAMFMLFDQILVQNALLGLIFTFSATLVMNYVPLVIANEIHAMKREKNHKPFMMVLYSGIFAVVAGMTVALRVSTKEQLFTSVFTGSEDYSSIMTGVSVSPDSVTADIAVWILAIIPCATSMVSLYLSLLDHPSAVKLRKLLAARKALENQLIKLSAQRARLERDYEGELRSWDAVSRQAFLEQEQCAVDGLRKYYQTLLMMTAHSPEAINFITEKPLRVLNEVLTTGNEDPVDLDEF